MIYDISVKIASYLIGLGMDDEKKEIIQYGLECIISELITSLLILFISLFLKNFSAIIVWHVFFMPIRVTLGGYHATNHFFCILVSCITPFIGLFIGHVISIILPVIVIVLCVSALFTKPIVHKNHPLSNNQYIRAYKSSRIILILGFIGICFLYLRGSYYFVPASIGFINAILFAIIGKLRIRE